jgi:hypothetical protein
VNGLKPIDYEEMPTTIRYQVGSNDEFTTPITTVKSGLGTNKVTFRIWLEGWDSDCFDGLIESISVKLTFKSKQIY